MARKDPAALALSAFVAAACLLGALVVLAAALALAACASPIPASRPMRDGRAAAPPEGWVSYCLRHPGKARCSS